MVEVDAVEDLMEFAKIKRSGGTVPQLTKPDSLLPAYISWRTASPDARF